MSENRSNKALFLVALFFISVLSPVLGSVSADSDEEVEKIPYNAGGVIIGDLKDFDTANGSQYLLIDEEQPVVSAYGFMKQAWIDAGRPGVDDMKYQKVIYIQKKLIVRNSLLLYDEEM